MKTLLATLILTALILAPAPRCKLVSANGAYWFVCPCKGVTYQCEDYYRAGKTYPRRWTP